MQRLMFCLTATAIALSTLGGCSSGSAPRRDPAQTGVKMGALGIGEPIFENSYSTPKAGYYFSSEHYAGANLECRRVDNGNIVPLSECVSTWAWDTDQQIDAILNLRPEIFRMHIPFAELFDPYGNTKFSFSPDGKVASSSYEQASRALMIARRFKQAKVPILGVAHRFPTWMTGVSSLICGGAEQNWNSVPRPDYTAGSSYRFFLMKYRDAWAKISRAFPEIGSWEPANETNGGYSLLPEQTTCGTTSQFTYDDRIKITVDLMTMASDGIKAGNPNAIVYMPPPGPVTEADPVFPSQDLQGIADFIDKLYSRIKSGNSITGRKNPASYFDAISYHPYIFQKPNLENWVRQNEEIRKVIAAQDGRKLTITFSEMGNSEMNWDHVARTTVPVDAEELSQWLKETVLLTRSKLPWVNHIVWFRGMDSPQAAVWGGLYEKKFGILNEWTAGPVPFPPKASADTFCNLNKCRP